jgi:mannose-6-phosphate isomerase-like protein (cupin superfamily)
MEERVYAANIEYETLNNPYYRQVLHTTPQMQLVVMKLHPGEFIPPEIHPRTSQFIRVESGQALVELDEEEILLNDDEVVIIPAGTRHKVSNVGVEDLAIYTIYSPPEHPPKCIQISPRGKYCKNS